MLYVCLHLEKHVAPAARHFQVAPDGAVEVLGTSEAVRRWAFFPVGIDHASLLVTVGHRERSDGTRTERGAPDLTGSNVCY